MRRKALHSIRLQGSCNKTTAFEAQKTNAVIQMSFIAALFPYWLNMIINFLSWHAVTGIKGGKLLHKLQHLHPRIVPGL